MIEFDDNDTDVYDDVDDDIDVDVDVDIDYDVDVDINDDVDDDVDVAQEQKKTARWWSARDLHRRRFAFLSSL